MQKRNRESLKFYLMVVLVFTITLGGAYAVWHWVGPTPIEKFPTSLSDAGAYGDSYGFVNSLLSSLALAGAIAAIVLQTIELRWQRLELQESQETWKHQAEESRQQALVMAEQVAQLRLQNETSQRVAELQYELAIVELGRGASNDLAFIDATEVACSAKAEVVKLREMSQRQHTGNIQRAINELSMRIVMRFHEKSDRKDTYGMKNLLRDSYRQFERFALDADSLKYLALIEEMMENDASMKHDVQSGLKELIRALSSHYEHQFADITTPEKPT